MNLIQLLYFLQFEFECCIFNFYTYLYIVDIETLEVTLKVFILFVRI